MLNIKTLAASLLMLLPGLLHAEAPIPFNQWVNKNPNWSKDRKEIGYALTRCGSLFFTVGSYMEQNAASKEILARAQDAKIRGTMLSVAATPLNKENGLTADFLEQRTAALMKGYMDLIISNRAIHNNLFHGQILEDYQFCRTVEATLK